MTRRSSRVRKPTTPCIFYKGFVTEVIDAKVDRMWKDGFGVVKVPFGDLRNMFRRHHCRTLNPYGDSERCPFDKKECALAFLEAIQVTVQARPRVPVGYFIEVAKSSAARRADEGVERRAAAARLRRTDVHPEPASAAHATPASTSSVDDPRGVGAAASDGAYPRSGRDEAVVEGSRPFADDPAIRPDGVALPRRSDGPISVGDLLRGVAPRSRQGRPQTGSEGG